jgi:hypothetical protein
MPDRDLSPKFVRYADLKPLEEPPGTYIDLANFIPSEPIVDIPDCIPHNIARAYVCLNDTMFAIGSSLNPSVSKQCPSRKIQLAPYAWGKKSQLPNNFFNFSTFNSLHC